MVQRRQANRARAHLRCQPDDNVSECAAWKQHRIAASTAPSGLQGNRWNQLTLCLSLQRGPQKLCDKGQHAGQRGQLLVFTSAQMSQSPLVNDPDVAMMSKVYGMRMQNIGQCVASEEGRNPYLNSNYVR